MLPRIPEWQMAMLAAFRIGAIAIPCITMLTPKDLDYRIKATAPRAIVTIPSQTAKIRRDHRRCGAAGRALRVWRRARLG